MRLRRSQAAGSELGPAIEPNPLRTPDDAYETGLLVGLLGSWRDGFIAKNLKDRRIARGDAETAPGVRAAGKAAGRRAGSPPDGTES
jgi:hypothetical protein